MAVNNDVLITVSLKDLASSGLSNLSKSFSSIGKSANAMGKTLTNVAKKAFVGTTVAVAGLGAALVGLAKRGIDVAGDLQQASNAYEVLLGSAEKATDAMNKIKQDAAKTPFDMRELIRANQMLISTGLAVDDSRKAVLALGNAIVATGGGQEEFNRMIGNLQQVRNVGKATEMDIRQFGFAGINIYKLLADSTGKTIPQLKEMDITYEMLSGALIKAQEAGGMFAGALDKQGSSWNLLKSNLTDVINIVLASAVTDTGLFAFLNKQLQDLVNFLTNNKEAISAFFVNTANTVREFITTVAEVIRKWWELWQQGLVVLQQIWEKISAVGKIIWDFLGPSIVNLVNELGIMIKTIFGANVNWSDFFNVLKIVATLLGGALLLALRMVLDLVGLLARAINIILGPAVSGVTAVFNVWNSAILMVVEGVKSLVTWLQKAWDKIKQLPASVAKKLGFGENRATGGFVMQGQPYMVGERGPELFVPHSSGRVVPNNQLQSSGNSINMSVNIGVYAGTQTEKRRLAEELYQGLVDLALARGTTVAGMLGA